MALKDDPEWRQIHIYVPRSYADALSKIAADLRVSRSELLRRVACDVIENYREQDE